MIETSVRDEFDSTKYVERVPEERVLSAWFLSGRGRVLRLLGGAGTGKTWLLLHYESLFETTKTSAESFRVRGSETDPSASALLGENYVFVYTDLAAAKPTSELDTYFIRLLTDIRQSLSKLITLPNEREWEARSFHEQIHAVVRLLNSMAMSTLRVVVLCDHVDQADPDVLRRFDAEFLQPLLDARSVRAVLTGRLTRYTWGFQVRSAFDPTSSIELSAFVPRQAEEQAERLNQPDLLHPLRAYGYQGQHPLANAWLVEHAAAGRDLSNRVVAQQALADCVRQVILNRPGHTHPPLTDEQVSRLRDVAVLEYLDIIYVREFLRHALGVVLSDRGISQDLIKPWLQAGHMLPNAGNGLYKVSEALQAILLAWLWAEQGRESVVQRHEAAVAMFDEFAGLVGTSDSAQYEAGARYHRAQIQALQRGTQP